MSAAFVNLWPPPPGLGPEFFTPLRDNMLKGRASIELIDITTKSMISVDDVTILKMC
ncbi:hypothetical protein Sjap_022800 [Stephania japonica]|uniref:Uncharacterized protein n=1 Tax=Stephania japonica TaxID=461633 RepID=A0AAP0HQ76_9MAGN